MWRDRRFSFSARELHPPTRLDLPVRGSSPPLVAWGELGKPPRRGDLYSVDNADGGFRVIEILAVTDTGAQVTLYGNHYPERPRQIDRASLSLDADTGHGYAGPGLESQEVTPAASMTWKPQIVTGVPAPNRIDHEALAREAHAKAAARRQP